jgi:redox-sensitive bicupin YhaK (pirin superfamily)
MDDYRQVRKVVTGTATEDGAGVKLTRVLDSRTVGDFDPFLMLDVFDSTSPDDYIKGFPWHPHRGIETVTYLISGNMEHGDSMGNRGRIRDGECQWMTAGSGVTHQEMPQPTDRMQGMQLWINLPAKDKMTPPAYNSITADSVQRVREDGADVKVIAGRYKDTGGAFQGKFVDAAYLDVTIAPGAKWDYVTVPENTLFVYIYGGEGYFSKLSDEIFSAKRALLFTHGKYLHVTAGKNGVRFILLTAMPLYEPVAWGGPIVMNTRDELLLAFREIEDGTFVKSGGPDA